jgi:hypothetical protein
MRRSTAPRPSFRACVVDSAKDTAGRAGVGRAFGVGGDRDVWVFDKKSLTYLGSDDVALLQVGVVDHLGQALNR